MTNSTKPHPFAELINLETVERGEGECTNAIPFSEKLLNPNGVVHGGVLYSMADTGMGGALDSLLEDGELCATIEIKITYLRPAGREDLRCTTRVLKKGRRVAMLESDIYSGDILVAKASGSFAVFTA